MLAVLLWQHAWRHWLSMQRPFRTLPIDARRGSGGGREEESARQVTVNQPAQSPSCSLSNRHNNGTRKAATVGIWPLIESRRSRGRHIR
jgi:hypothetical protein